MNDMKTDLILTLRQIESKYSLDRRRVMDFLNDHNVEAVDHEGPKAARRYKITPELDAELRGTIDADARIKKLRAEKLQVEIQQKRKDLGAKSPRQKIDRATLVLFSVLRKSARENYPRLLVEHFKASIPAADLAQLPGWWESAFHQACVQANLDFWTAHAKQKTFIVPDVAINNTTLDDLTRLTLHEAGMTERVENDQTPKE